MYVLYQEKAKKILIKVNKWMQMYGHILMGHCHIVNWGILDMGWICETRIYLKY